MFSFESKTSDDVKKSVRENVFTVSLLNYISRYLCRKLSTIGLEITTNFNCEPTANLPCWSVENIKNALRLLFFKQTQCLKKSLIPIFHSVTSKQPETVWPFSLCWCHFIWHFLFYINKDVKQTIFFSSTTAHLPTSRTAHRLLKDNPTQNSSNSSVDTKTVFQRKK